MVIPSHPGNSALQAHLFVNKSSHTRDRELAYKRRFGTGPRKIKPEKVSRTGRLPRRAEHGVTAALTK